MGEGMIQSESRMRENRTSGLMSGRRKRNHGSRTEAHRESGGYATGPYSWRASRRLYDMMKSDAVILATKGTNKGPYGPAESLEPSTAPKRKSTSPHTYRTQERGRVSQGAKRLRQFVRQNPRVRLTTLLHHINVETLRSAFYGSAPRQG